MKKGLLILISFVLFQTEIYSQCPAPMVSPDDLVNVISNPGFESGTIAPSNAGSHNLVACCSSPGTYMVGGLSTDFNIGMIPNVTPRSGSYMLMIDNITAPDAVAWEQTVTVQPNKLYYFSAWLTALSPTEKSQMVFQVQPIAPVAGPAIDISQPFIPPDGPEWEQYFGTWFSGATTTVTIRLVNSNPLAAGGNGNDYAIDDIMFRASCLGSGAGPRPDFGAESLSICNNGGSINLNSNVPNHANHTYTWFRDGIEVANPATPDILENQATPGTYIVCVDSSGCVNADTVTLVAPLAIELGPNLHLCDPAFKLLDTKISNPGAFDIKWYKDNVLIPGQVYSTYMATGAGTYRVEVSNGASCSGFDEVTITSDVVETIGDFICPSEGNSSATVSVVDASGSSYSWYDQPTGGTLLGTGTTYTANDLTEPTVFYVESSDWMTSGGGLPNSASAFLAGSSVSENNFHAQNFMNFDALKSGKIDFVTVRLRFFGDVEGDVTITLEDRTVPSTTTTTYTINNTAGAGDHNFVIPVNMNIEAGHNYWFSIAGINGQFFTLRYADGPINTYFPSTYEAVRFNGGQAPTVYPGLFDWKFSHPSTCARTPASVVSNCPLPVEWLSFDGELINGKVFLRWSTASEINNSFFEIQRSADGHYFETIGKKEGGNNTNSISLYKFTDYSPLQGISYYRLIQHDFDGNVYYTPSISIYTHNKPFVISPNPFTDVVSVRAFEGATIIVTDMLGKVLLHDVLKSDEYHFGNELVSGTYIVSLIHENSTEHKVVIKK